MNAINHAATALIIKKRWPRVPIIPVLISVQFVELLWVILNIAGVEKTTYEHQVRAVSDIHLSHMPFSHSVASSILLALAAWGVLKLLKSTSSWALPIGIGLLSHIALDIAVHVPDIEIIPFLGWPEIGSGIYGVPLLALFIETGYAVLVWKIVRGSWLMLGALVVLNLASLSFYVPQITGPEALLVQYPQAFAFVVLGHIILGLVAVGWLHQRESRNRPLAGDA